mgnify:FL=1
MAGEVGMDELVRLPEAARYLGLQERSLRQVVLAGRIPDAVQLPHPRSGLLCWAIPRATLESIEVTADGYHRWPVKADGAGDGLDAHGADADGL